MNPNDSNYYDSFYRLQSAVYHFGSHDYGHFIAYRRVRRGGSLNKELQIKIKELINKKVTDYVEWEKLFKKPEYLTNNKSNTSKTTDSSNKIENCESETKETNDINTSNSELDDYQWFRISDSSVELIIDPEMELFNNGSPYVYMLFYESLSEYNLSKKDKEKLVFEEKKKFKNLKNEVMMNNSTNNKSNIINPFFLLNTTVTQNSNNTELKNRNISIVDEDDVE
eukprot:jgi/Orpsp1_1/1174738/evm.model.c7180000051214.2